MARRRPDGKSTKLCPDSLTPVHDSLMGACATAYKQIDSKANKAFSKLGLIGIKKSLIEHLVF